MPFLLSQIETDLAIIEKACGFIATLPLSAGPHPEPGVLSNTRRSPTHDVFVPLKHRELEEITVRFDPYRARIEARGRREIARDHKETEGGVCERCVVIIEDQPVPVPYPCATLAVLTWGYDKHDGYDPAWNDPWATEDGNA